MQTKKPQSVCKLSGERKINWFKVFSERVWGNSFFKKEFPHNLFHPNIFSFSAAPMTVPKRAFSGMRKRTPKVVERFANAF